MENFKRTTISIAILISLLLAIISTLALMHQTTN